MGIAEGGQPAGCPQPTWVRLGFKSGRLSTESQIFSEYPFSHYCQLNNWLLLCCDPLRTDPIKHQMHSDPASLLKASAGQKQLSCKSGWLLENKPHYCLSSSSSFFLCASYFSPLSRSLPSLLKRAGSLLTASCSRSSNTPTAAVQ